MSVRVGLAPAFKRVVLAPKFARNQVALRSAISRRHVLSSTERTSEEILNQQRLKRPSSPHFTIYQPQLTWLASIANRVTGVGLSTLLYGFSLAYLVAPDTFDSGHIIAFVAGLPDYIKYTAKVVLAAPFSFHAFNGLRHLAWDTGKFLTLKSAYKTGYAVLGATAISTVALVLM
ncbi:hypothetical protein ID866_6123 [Astraeus odoratus]|nr:hypothetical protein ID866_6123 [Astraeus odoratus]